MKALTRGCVVLFAMLLVLPVFQWAIRPFRPASLGGVELKAAAPAVTWKGWFDGSLQKQIEEWLNERLGIRAYFIRTYNQIQFSLYRKLPAGKGTSIIIGKDFWLYESSYVQTYNREDRTGENKLRRIVEEVKRLQDKLKARNKAFLLVLAPSKVEIYPEYLPPGILKPGREQRQTDYERIRPMLDEYGVSYIDGPKMFREKKTSQPHKLFATGGTHWNYYGAGMVVSEIFDRLGGMLGKKLFNVACKSVKIDREPVGTDDDLAKLLNIWNTKSIAGPQVHPVFDRQAGDYLPNILFVGDSFVFTLVDVITDNKLASQCDIFYYFKRQYSADREKSSRIEPESVDWNSEVLSRDAVIIEINEHWLPEIGFGFPKAALAGIDALENSRPR